MTELKDKDLEEVNGGLDVENPFGLDDPSKPGSGNYSFLAEEDIHYDQIVLENQ